MTGEKGAPVTDYGSLADKLKGRVEAAKPAHGKQPRDEIDPAVFYESVKAQIEMEVKEANVELRKRGLPIVERIFMPGFLGKLVLTYGTALLCSVELHGGKGRIKSVIIGPPNRSEISRKEYLINPAAADPQRVPADESENLAVGYTPDRIAAEIVSGLLTGEFV